MLEMERKLWGPPFFFIFSKKKMQPSKMFARHTYFLFLAKKKKKEISKRLEPQLANACKKIDL